jgi:predicted RNA-binding protein with PUA-like domain
VAGIVKIVRAAYPDPTAFDRKSEYYDAKSTPAKPIWFVVDVKFVRAFGYPVPLAAIRAEPALKKMPLVQRGSRLSVMPVTAREWSTILNLEKDSARGGKKI